MRSLVDMDTIQIEITNACPRLYKCSNCTRMGQHMKKPFFMCCPILELYENVSSHAERLFHVMPYFSTV